MQLREKEAGSQTRGRELPPQRLVLIILVSVLILGCFLLMVGAFWIATFGQVRSSRESPPPTIVVSSQATDSTLPILPTPGSALEGGLTDRLLRAEVWSTIVSFQANVRGCNEVEGGKIEITQLPDSSGSWEEAWTITACGERKILKIKFTVPPDGGVYYDIAE